MGGGHFSGSEAGSCTACYIQSFSNSQYKHSGLTLGANQRGIEYSTLVQTKFGVMEAPINVDEDNLCMQDSEFVKIEKNTCFLFSFQKKARCIVQHFFENMLSCCHACRCWNRRYWLQTRLVPNWYISKSKPWQFQLHLLRTVNEAGSANSCLRSTKVPSPALRPYSVSHIRPSEFRISGFPLCISACIYVSIKYVHQINWKCNFPMTHLVCRLVSWLVGFSVINSENFFLLSSVSCVVQLN